ncbi:MAG: Hint domain-containing protein [Aliishimia sp.]
MKPKTVGRVFDESKDSQNAHSLCHGIPVGTSILTADGTIPVEYLSTGDRLVTRNGGMLPLMAIQSEAYATRGIKFTANCFGSNGPTEDAVLPADQPVLIRDWRARALFGQSQAMASASWLVDDEFIIDMGPRRLTLFRLAFDRPRVIYAGGLELGTSAEVNTPHRAVA